MKFVTVLPSETRPFIEKIFENMRVIIQQREFGQLLVFFERSFRV